jgi:hypothetical protein
MRCQHIDDETNEQCQEEATRDIRIKTVRQGWRLFLCDDHHDEEVATIRAYIDKMAVEQESKR